VAKARAGTMAIVIGAIMVTLSATALLSALIFLLVGGSFSLIFPLVFGLPVNDLKLNQDAGTTTGTIVEVEPTPELEVMSEPTVRLTYRYEVAGAAYEGDVQVRESHELTALGVDSSATVEYLPDDPGVSRLEGSKHAVAGWGGALGLGFGGAGLIATICAAMPVLLGVAVMFLGFRARARSIREEAAGA